MTIVLASNNLHKKKELEEIFSDHHLVIPEDLGISYYYEETGKSYIENAYGKAETAFHLLRTEGKNDFPVLSDDSGLSLPVLDGAPGIYSSRYGSLDGHQKLDASGRNLYLLKQLEGTKDPDAFYVCCMVLFLEEYRFYVVQETWHGQITDQPKGEGGFGYDPVFFLPQKGKTAAELKPEEKNRLSHRGKAARGIASIIKRNNYEFGN